MLKLIIEYDPNLFAPNFLEAISREITSIVAGHFDVPIGKVMFTNEADAGLAIIVEYSAHNPVFYGFDPARDLECMESICSLLQGAFANAIGHHLDLVPIMIMPTDMQVTNPVQINAVFNY